MLRALWWAGKPKQKYRQSPRAWGVVVVVAQRRRVGSRCVSVGGVPVGVETNRSHGVRD